MLRERILVTAKTYPTLSKKYGELVCTAGVREDGSWVRLYPVPFRRLDEKDRYTKYDWIETSTRGTSGRARRRLLLEKGVVFDRLRPLMDGAKANRLSLLGVFPVPHEKQLALI